MRVAARELGQNAAAVVVTACAEIARRLLHGLSINQAGNHWSPLLHIRAVQSAQRYKIPVWRMGRVPEAPHGEQWVTAGHPAAATGAQQVTAQPVPRFGLHALRLV